MHVRFFDPGKSYLNIKPEIDAVMQDVLTRGDLILRHDVDDFEKNFAAYVGTKYAVAVASGTDALILSLKAAGIKKGDTVLCPSYTFRATVEAVHHAGGIPVLYDMDGNIHLNLRRRHKFFIPAHIAGEVLMYPKCAEDLAKDGIITIEDACQAVGAAPVTGLAACYSFYPAKLLGCYGDGGAIATNSEEMYNELLKLRNHYKGDWSKYAYNSRLDNLQAAVLNVKLKYLPGNLQRRREIARMYDAKLLVSYAKLPTKRDIYQDYIIEIPDRDDLKAYLAEQGIETMDNGYPFPAGLKKKFLTVAYEARSLRLPCNENLTDEEVLYVIDKINEYANGN